MNDYKIKELEEEMELHLIKSMKKNLQRHLDEEEKVGFKFTQWQAEKLKELKRYQRENKKIIDGYTKGLDKNVSIHLKRELNKGSINAIKLHNKALGTNLKPSRLMNHSFFKTNDRKVNNLIKVVNNDLDKANASALRMVNDQYRQIIHKSVFFSSNGVMTEKQAIDMATKDFLSSGINCIEYKNGRRVNIASYSQMAVRTASLRAQLMGEGDFRKSIGRTLVKVTSHNGACELCTGWQGKILVDDVYSGGEPDGEHILLSEAMEQGFLHPNCRHGLMTYYPEIEGIKYDEPETDIEEELHELLQEKLNYCERQEKKYNRLEVGSIDNNNVEKYRQLKNKWIMQEKQIKFEKDLNSIIYKHSQDVYNKYIANGYENLSIINPIVNKRIGKITTSNNISGVDYSNEQKKLMLKFHRKLYSIHNHPGNNTFSIEDIYELFENPSLCGIIVTTDKYNYYLIPKYKDLDIVKDNIDEFSKWFEKMLGKTNDEMYGIHSNLAFNDAMNLSYKKIFDKLGWNYGRIKK